METLEYITCYAELWYRGVWLSCWS